MDLTKKEEEESRFFATTFEIKNVVFNTIRNQLNVPLLPGSIATIDPVPEYEQMILSGKSCYYFPFCCKSPAACGGYKETLCSQVSSGFSQVPGANDFFLAVKKQAKYMLQLYRQKLIRKNDKIKKIQDTHISDDESSQFDQQQSIITNEIKFADNIQQSKEDPKILKKVNKKLPIFLQDPTRLYPLSVSMTQILALNNDGWLSTGLMDYLLQRSLPESIPASTLIASTDSMSIINILLDKINFNQYQANQVESVKKMRLNYQRFSTKRYKVFASICHH